MKKFVFVFIAMFSLFAQSATADFLGLGNGRSANLDNMANMSVEGGINLFSGGRLFGTRANFKASDDLLLFGDIGMYSIGADGLAFGGGAYYQLRSVTLLENTDFGVRGAYHIAQLDDSGFDLDYSEIAIDAVISGDKLGDTELGWYANAGMHILSIETPRVNVLGFSAGGTVNSNKIALAGGIVGPLSFGEYFAGIEIIDGTQFVAGIRYNL